MKTRVIVIAAIVVFWVVAALVLVEFLPQRQARITPTATRTPKPTFTPLPTATQTLTPSPTPLPTNTSTPTPVPTNTPIPTDTPLPTNTPTVTPIPSDTPTPLPSPTPTRKPTSPPAKPRPTATPKPTQPPPLPFTGEVVGGSARCDGFTAVTGTVKHANGSPYGGVAVGVWSDAWDGWTSVSKDDGKWDVNLGGLPPGKFYVAVVRLETCSQRDGLPTARDCQRLSNIVDNVYTTDKCSGQGASQVPVVDFSGP